MPPSFRSRKAGKLTGRRPRTPQQRIQSEIDRSITSALKSHIEPKVCYNLLTGGISSSGTITSATAGLARGDLPVNNYQGWLIKPVSLRVRYVYSTDQTFSTVRLMIFQWLDASTPVPGGVLQTVGSAIAPLSPINWSNIGKVRVKYDCTYTLKPRVTAGFDAKYFDTGYLTGFAPIQFDQAAGANPQLNEIFILMITDDLIISFPTISLESELIFTDA